MIRWRVCFLSESAPIMANVYWELMCDAYTHTLTYKHTHRAHAKSSNAADFFPPPHCGCCHGNKLRISGFEKLNLTGSVSVSGGAVGIIRGVWTGAGVDLLLLLRVFAQVHRGVLIAPKTLTPYVNICWPPGSTRVKGSQTQTPAPVDSILQLYTFHRETLVCENVFSVLKCRNFPYYYFFTGVSTILWMMHWIV